MNKIDSTIAFAWVAYLGVIVYLTGEIGAVVIPLAAIMMVPLIVLMSTLSKRDKKESLANMMTSSDETEKRKRKRIDAMIRDMSDDELYELRQRLQDGSFDDEVFYDQVVGDDGEFVRRQ
ncbi:MAG: hypothetical protein AAF846_29540 [Chloroflexota bacterium]